MSASVAVTTRREVILKTAVVHTVTYFMAGVAAYTLFDYPDLLANTALGTNFRPLSHPMVLAGPLLQPIRGAVFGWVFYLLRGPFFGRNGWLIMWATLFVFGVFGTFAAPAGSIEGAIYLTIPLWLHFATLPEITIQPLLLSFFVFQWVTHPEKKWLGRAFWVAFFAVASVSALAFVAGLRGAESALGLRSPP